VGGGDLVIDPKDPQVLYAALYARRRTPWSFTAGPAATDGKDLGGIFKTTDGGTTWRKLAAGLPAGTGRIGLAVYAKDPKVVYAIVQSEEAGGTIDAVRSRRGGVFRSDDGGETWTRTSPLNPRPFYFSQIRVDPANDKRVYVLGFALHVSDDGGRSFREDLFEKVHPDNHALAIDPRDPKHLLLGTDGGPYQSYKAGEGWEHLSRMAAGEFYRINVDTQDSLPHLRRPAGQPELGGPEPHDSKDGIVNADWISLGGRRRLLLRVRRRRSAGRLLRVAVRHHPAHGPAHRTDEGAASGAGGGLGRRSASTGTPRSSAAGTIRTSCTWPGTACSSCAPAPSTGAPSAPTCRRRTRRRRRRWERGGDLRGRLRARGVAPSAKGLLWAGTDDGKLWVTENGGASWTDLSANVPAPRAGSGSAGSSPATRTARSRTSPSTPIAPARSAPRLSHGRPGPDLAGDHGRPARPGAGQGGARGPREPQVLYAGTEFGLFASFDRGSALDADRRPPHRRRRRHPRSPARARPRRGHARPQPVRPRRCRARSPSSRRTSWRRTRTSSRRGPRWPRTSSRDSRIGRAPPASTAGPTRRKARS
jgi:photosystem II stability/assembly factor-like uncharacterized protein